jgi:hypothetical protein
MKTRNGFVSNSSSSSFIVAVKQHSDACPTCGRRDPDFLDMVEHMGNSDGYETTKLHHRTAQDIWEKGEESRGYQPQNRGKSPLFGVMVDAEHKGYKVAEIEISYHDTSTTEMMSQMEATKNLIVLWSDHRDIKPKNIKL